HDTPPVARPLRLAACGRRLAVVLPVAADAPEAAAGTTRVRPHRRAAAAVGMTEVARRNAQPRPGLGVARAVAALEPVVTLDATFAGAVVVVRVCVRGRGPQRDAQQRSADPRYDSGHL